MEKIEELRYFLDNFETAPRFQEMPRLTLNDKGSAGPTGAHFIEEVHTPLNLAYISVTTGSTAFQNIVGVTRSELALRIEAGKKALEQAGISAGDRLLITYPPLVNVFCKDALEGLSWFFPERSCRNALLWAMCKERPRVVLGESSFLRVSLEDAIRLGLLDELRKDTVFLAAGTPLDPELPAMIAKHGLGEVHDLYGCQEYGWLTMDGRELREDICIVPSNEKEDYFHVVAGGLPTGDCFPVADNGEIITSSRIRTRFEPEATITHTTAIGEDTIYRLIKTILRIKGKILRVSPGLITGAAETRIEYPLPTGGAFVIRGPEKTMLFDALLDAQIKYQSLDKKDPVWMKREEQGAAYLTRRE